MLSKACAARTLARANKTEDKERIFITRFIRSGVVVGSSSELGSASLLSIPHPVAFYVGRQWQSTAEQSLLWSVHCRPCCRGGAHVVDDSQSMSEEPDCLQKVNCHARLLQQASFMVKTQVKKGFFMRTDMSRIP